jgi:alpha-tubulin suppressor-like RCC1 family protein
VLKTTPGRIVTLTALVTALSVAGSTGLAAAAKKPAVTHLGATAAPATALVGGVVTVTGTVTPKATTALVLQRLVGKTWTTLAHVKAGKTGAYAVTLHAPKKPATLTLRVTRVASATAKAGVSGTLHVRVVKTAFKVTAVASGATLTTAQTLTVSGKVTPKGTGSISLDKAVGTTWVSLGKATLTKTSTYRFAKALPAGSYKLRVSKTFTKTVAGGVSASFHAVVSTAAGPPTTPPTTPPALANPVVSTTSLVAMVVGKATTTTMAATLGTAPYSWAVISGALPAGLSMVPSGIVSGRPTAVGVSSFTVRVTDTLGHSGTGSVTATVAPVVVKAWGYNTNGELGIGSTTNTDSIVTVKAPNSVSAVSGEFDYTLALETNGTVWAWGDNSSGQLGLGDTLPRTTPTQVTALSGIVAIAAGVTSGYAVTAGGAVYSWGANASGELGTGVTSMTPTLTPALIPSLSNIISVTAGDRFALALTGNGRVDAWGDGTDGVIGDGNNNAQVPTPLEVPPLGRPAVAIAATSTASYALLDDGTVRSWGLKEHGQLGWATLSLLGTTQPSPGAVTGLTNVTSIACTGFEFCLARHTDGTVSAWGYGATGAMGNGTTGDNNLAALVPGLTNVTAIATAHTTSYAVRSDGTVASWGYDGSNELGNGDATHTNTSTPATVPGLTKAFAIGAGSQDAYALTG